MNEGMTNCFRRQVGPEHTAARLGSGLLEVLATPMMVAGMEQVCAECVAPHLDPGSGTVGISVNITHDAPSPVGMMIEYRCTLTKIEGKKLTFAVEAYDEVSLIGKGEHVRFAIENNKFIQKCQARLDKK